MKKLICFATGIFLLAFTCSANSAFFPGYYLTLQGDTVQCEINFSDWNLNPKTIEIKTGAGPRNFSPSDIKGFGVHGYNDYVSAVVRYHTQPVEGLNIPHEYSDSTLERKCFLKVMQKGNYNLYDLIYPDRVYFFYSVHGGEIKELVYRVREINDTTSYDRSYRTVIFGFFAREGSEVANFNRINTANYNASDLGFLFHLLNANQYGVDFKKNHSGAFEAGIFGGALRTSFPDYFNSIYIQSIQFEPSTTFSGGINFTYGIPGKFKSFKVGLSMAYNTYHSEMQKSGVRHDSLSQAAHSTTTYSEMMQLKNQWISPALYLMFVANPRNRFQVFLKGGLSYNFSLNEQFWATSSYTATKKGVINGNVPVGGTESGDKVMFAMKGNYLSFEGGLGFIYGRHRLEFVYWPEAKLEFQEISTYQDDYKSSYKISSMAVYYHFSIFPFKR